MEWVLFWGFLTRKGVDSETYLEAPTVFRPSLGGPVELDVKILF